MPIGRKFWVAEGQENLEYFDQSTCSIRFEENNRKERQSKCFYMSWLNTVSAHISHHSAWRVSSNCLAVRRAAEFTCPVETAVKHRFKMSTSTAGRLTSCQTLPLPGTTTAPGRGAVTPGDDCRLPHSNHPMSRLDCSPVTAVAGPLGFLRELEQHFAQ